MRVIIDGVFNHCGWRFFAFEDVVQKGEASRYKDWFYRLEFPVVRPEDPEAIPGYECFGYERLMPKLDTANPEVREYFCSVGEHWVREYGIDGWRLDVASEVDDSFWREFRRRVKAAKPEALLIGEVWESAGHWLDGSMFDSAMNYELRRHCRRFFAEQTEDAFAFSGRCTGMLMRYRRQLVPAQLNLLDSHDVGRFLSLCGGDVRRYRLAVLFQLCFPGIPSVFYGDELGAPVSWRPTTAALCPGRAGMRNSCLLPPRHCPAPGAGAPTPRGFPLRFGGARQRALRLFPGIRRRAGVRGRELLR